MRMFNALLWDERVRSLLLEKFNGTWVLTATVLAGQKKVVEDTDLELAATTIMVWLSTTYPKPELPKKIRIGKSFPKSVEEKNKHHRRIGHAKDKP